MNKRITIAIGFLSAALLLALTAPVARADGKLGGGDGEGWQIISPTYMWLSALEGDVTLRGNTADIDLGFDEIFEHTDIGVQLYLEIRKPKFGFWLQPNYMKLSADGTSPAGQVEDELQLWIVEGGAFYNIGRWDPERPLTLDVLAGLRYWSLHNELTVGGARSANTVELYDPIIGLRVRKYVTEKLSLSLRGDIGGFDLGSDTSRFSWQIVPMVGYDFNRYFTGFVGYRALAIETEEGSGANKQGANLKFNGVLLGFNFDFFGWLARNKH